jgi:hypothetical protein
MVWTVDRGFVPKSSSFTASSNTALSGSSQASTGPGLGMVWTFEHGFIQIGATASSSSSSSPSPSSSSSKSPSDSNTKGLMDSAAADHKQQPGVAAAQGPTPPSSSSSSTVTAAGPSAVPKGLQAGGVRCIKRSGCKPSAGVYGSSSNKDSVMGLLSPAGQCQVGETAVLMSCHESTTHRSHLKLSGLVTNQGRTEITCLESQLPHVAVTRSWRMQCAAWNALPVAFTVCSGCHSCCSGTELKPCGCCSVLPHDCLSLQFLGGCSAVKNLQGGCRAAWNWEVDMRQQVIIQWCGDECQCPGEV